MLIIDGKIVVVHIRKAGGTSFCKGLLKLLPPERVEAFGYFRRFGAGGRARAGTEADTGADTDTDGEADIGADGPGEAAAGAPRPLWKHSTAADFVAARGGKGDHRLILVSTRPLLHRVASFYYYCARAHQRDPARYRWTADLPFRAYLRSEWLYADTLEGFSTDAGGRVLIDQFVPYAGIGAAYTALCAELGFPGQSLPRLNTSQGEKKRDYDALYRPKDLELLADRLRAEEAFLSRIAAEAA